MNQCECACVHVVDTQSGMERCWESPYVDCECPPRTYDMLYVTSLAMGLVSRTEGTTVHTHHPPSVEGKYHRLASGAPASCARAWNEAVACGFCEWVDCMALRCFACGKNRIVWNVVNVVSAYAC